MSQLAARYGGRLNHTDFKPQFDFLSFPLISPRDFPLIIPTSLSKKSYIALVHCCLEKNDGSVKMARAVPEAAECLSARMYCVGSRP